MNSFPTEERVYLHPFNNAGRLLLDRESGGGMGTVLQNILSERARMKEAGVPLDRSLRILSFDDRPLAIPSADIDVGVADNARRTCSYGDFYEHLYDDYPWHIQLHPDSVTAPAQEPEALRRMFALQCDGVVGSLEHASAYLSRYGISSKNPAVVAEIERLFMPLIDEVKPGSVMHWSMHSALPLMHAAADGLRERGVYQTYHHHFPEPDSLYRTAAGRFALEAQSLMDALYFHTDRDIKSFERQVEMLGLRMPDIVERFDLGIGTESLHRDAAKVTAENHRETIGRYGALGEEQKRVLAEIASAEHEKIPHQFVCIDRIDAHKGISVLLKGVEEFLSNADMPREELRERFRFFFFHELFDLDETDAHRIRHQYSSYVKESYHALQERFPGVIFVTNSIPRDAVAWALRGRTLLNASIQDGKNLACMEAAFVNSSDDESQAGLMVGSGTGFAIQANDDGFGDLFHEAKAGDSASVAAGIADIVRMQRSAPGVLRSNIRKLTEKFILPQQDSLFPDPVTMRS